MKSTPTSAAKVNAEAMRRFMRRRLGDGSLLGAVLGDEGEDVVGQLGAAHDDVGEVDVGLVVDQLAAVDPAREEAGRTGDGDRRGRVPLVLTAGVHVGV